jgi:hypothetical protein
VIQKLGDNVSALNSGFTRIEQKLDQLLARLDASDNENLELRRENENLRLELELLRAQKQGGKSFNLPPKGKTADDKDPAISSPGVGTFLPVSSLSTILSLSSLSISLSSVCARALSLSLSPLTLSVLAHSHACLTSERYLPHTLSLSLSSLPLPLPPPLSLSPLTCLTSEISTAISLCTKYSDSPLSFSCSLVCVRALSLPLSPSLSHH